MEQTNVCKMTIEDGLGFSMSVEILASSTIEEQIEAVTKLLYGSGWLLDQIQEGFYHEADRLNNEFEIIRKDKQGIN